MFVLANVGDLQRRVADMWCRRGTKDPIAKAMFEEDGIIILRNGRTVGEVYPGRIVRLGRGRQAIYDEGPNLFQGFVAGAVSDAVYARLGRKVKSTFTAEGAAHVAQTVVPEPIGAVDVKAALEGLEIHSMTVSLSGAVRRFIDEATAEKMLAACQATTIQDRYRSEGQSLYLVTETLVASMLVVTLDDTENHKADALAKADVVANLKLQGVKKSRTEAQIELTPQIGEVVVGIKAVEIVPSTAGGFMMKGLAKAERRIMGVEAPRNPVYMAPEDFSDDEELSMTISL